MKERRASPRIADTLEAVSIDNATAVIGASLPALNAGVFFLQRGDLRVDGETYDTFSGLVSGHAPEKLESRGVVLRIDVEEQALVIDDRLVLREAQLPFLALYVQLANSVALCTYHAGLRSGIKFVVVAVVDPGVPRQLRQRTFDLRLHLQLPEDVQAKVIASYRHFVPRRGERQLRRVIEQAPCKQLHLVGSRNHCQLYRLFWS